MALFTAGILPFLLQLLDPRAGEARKAVLKCAQIMNVPHRVLSELSNVNTILKPGKLNVVIVRAAHDELLGVAILTMGNLNDVDAVDHPAVDLDEPLLDDLV